MKKVLIIIFLIVFALFVLPNALAITTDLQDDYARSESMIIQITGSILEGINKNQVEFSRGNVLVSLDYDIKKINGNWYVWAIAPSNEGNYTFMLKNIATTELGKPAIITFEQNFSVNKNLISYYIKPGFISTSEDFQIDVYLNRDEPIEISVNYIEEWTEVLNPGKNTIDFSVSEIIGKQMINIMVGDYSIPAYIDGKGKEETVVLPDVRFKPRRIDRILYVGSEIPNYPFYIINSGNEKIDFELEFDKDLFILDPEIDSIVIEPGNLAEFNFKLKEKPKKNINETIYARSGEFEIFLPVQIILTENISEESVPYLDENFSETQGYYCSELNGKQCKTDELCGVSEISSLDGSCCVGTCSVERKRSKTWIGLLIAAIVIIIILLLWLKYKRTKGDKNPLGTRVKELERRP